MIFGQQIMEAEGHEQMDYEKGVNFWDTAEMLILVPARGGKPTGY
jgi:aryl-alcohol dehydrogenase-like predicted oxidoreductase